MGLARSEISSLGRVRAAATRSHSFQSESSFVEAEHDALPQGSHVLLPVLLLSDVYAVLAGQGIEYREDPAVNSSLIWGTEFILLGDVFAGDKVLLQGELP